MVGDIYAKGGTLPPNYAEAAMWFRRAVDAQTQGRRAGPGHAASDRCRRAARPGRGSAVVPHRRRGRRHLIACRPGQSAAEGPRRYAGFHPHPGMVRAGGGIRRPDRRIQFRRLSGGRRRHRAGRPKSRAMAAAGGGWRGQRTILVRPHAGRRPRRGKERRGGPRLDHARRRCRHDRGAGHAGRHDAERHRRSQGSRGRVGAVHQGRRGRPRRRHVRQRRDDGRWARRADGSRHGANLVPRWPPSAAIPTRR